MSILFPGKAPKVPDEEDLPDNVIPLRPALRLRWMRGTRGETIALCPRCLWNWTHRERVTESQMRAKERAHAKVCRTPLDKSH